MSEDVAKDKDGLELRGGMRLGAGGFFGIIVNETEAAHIVKSAGLLNEKPFKTIVVIPIIALKRHKVANELDDERKHAIKIGESFYDSTYLAALCEIMGTLNVELYQEGKNNPLGVKVKDQKAAIAPIIIGADVETVAEREKAEAEIAKIPTLDKVIDNYFSGKKTNDETPRFSLSSWKRAK